jgi:outer membrane protein, multidrug efflux system
VTKKGGDLGPAALQGDVMSRESMGQSKIFGITGMLVLLTASCVVGPHYQAPKVNVPGSYVGLASGAQGQTSAATQEPAEIAEWWKNFHDPELDSLISRAVQSNLSAREAQERILQARAAGHVAGAGLWPQATASGSAATTKTSAIGNSTSESSGTRNLFQAGLDAAWELDFFGGVRRGIEAANADIQAAVENSRDVMVSLTAEVALDYMDLRGLQQQIAIANENLVAQRQTAEYAQKRYGVGFASGLDVANADAQVATTLAQISPLEAAAKQTIYSLSVLLGQEPGALLSELSPAAVIPPVPPSVPVGLPSDLLERRPDIRSAEAQAHGATARIGVATADLFPKFSLTGALGLQSTALSTLTNGGTGSILGAGGVTWPIFNAGSIRANIQIQNAIQRQALLAYQQTVLTALQDVESALVAYGKEQQHHAAIADAVTANKTAVDLSTKLYVAGQTDFLNVLTAQRNLYATQAALVQSDQTIDTDLIALYKALGGGWQ